MVLARSLMYGLVFIGLMLALLVSFFVIPQVLAGGGSGGDPGRFLASLLSLHF